MALTLEQIDACFDGLMPSGSGKSRYDIARAIEAEVRRQDEALIRQLVEALENHQGNYKLTDAECVPVNAAIAAMQPL